ncbi:MAG: c-type cytochrome [Vicinamibacteria bacterium]
MSIARLGRCRVVAIAFVGACSAGTGDSVRGLDSDTRRIGAAVYGNHCASCHGARGEGTPDWKTRGPDGRLPPPPHDSTGHTWHHADGLLYRIVEQGTAGALGDTLHASRYGMPAFDSILTPREIHSVLTYLKAGWAPEQRRRQAEMSRSDPSPHGSRSP